MKIAPQIAGFLLVSILSGCSTVNFTSRQFIPKEAAKLTQLKKTAPSYQVDNIEFTHPDGAISRDIYEFDDQTGSAQRISFFHRLMN